MKKTFFLSIFIASFFSVSAQIKKGAVLLGADISFNSNNNKQESPNYNSTSTSKNFNLSLSAGKAIKDNLFAGGAFSFYTGKTVGSSSGYPDTEQKYNSFGASAWMRKYFPVYGPLYAFVNGSVGGSINREDRTGLTNKINGFALSVNFYPGISIQVKKSFYIDAALTNLTNIYYSHYSYEQTDGSGNNTQYSNNSYGISTSLGNSNNPLQLGLRWIIAK